MFNNPELVYYDNDSGQAGGPDPRQDSLPGFDMDDLRSPSSTGSSTIAPGRGRTSGRRATNGQRQVVVRVPLPVPYPESEKKDYTDF